MLAEPMHHARSLALLAVVVLVVTGCRSSTPPRSASTTLVDIGAGLRGPSGLHATVHARGLAHASAMTFDDQGRLWIATADYTEAGQDAGYVVDSAGATPVAA